MTQRYPFRYFKTSPEIIRLAVMIYIRFPVVAPKRRWPMHEQAKKTAQRHRY
jgi:putative transposase